jgi:hypothetical protein
MITGAVAGAGLWGMNALHASAVRALGQDVKLAQQAGDIQNLILLEGRYEKDSFINLSDPEKLKDYIDKWSKTRARLRARIGRGHQRNPRIADKCRQHHAECAPEAGHPHAQFSSAAVAQDLPRQNPGSSLALS